MPRESDVHPHVPIERASLFTCDDAGSTEHEYLEFLQGLIRISKPTRVLETGSWEGAGSYALAQALAKNHRGVLVCVDSNQAALDKAKKRISAIPNSQPTEYVCSNSLDYLGSYSGQPFDFAFLDSDLNVRLQELQTLIRGRMIVKGAIVCIHDTSQTRTHTDGSWDGRPADLAKGLGIMKDQGLIQEVMEFPLSRGITMLRV